MPDDPVPDRPREWLALPGGRVRPVISLHGADGDAELLPYAVWLARQRPLCDCGSPRLGSGRTCGSIRCIAGLAAGVTQPPAPGDTGGRGRQRQLP